MAPCSILSFQKSNVLVCRGSADVADPCEFRHIQLLALVSGVMAEKGGGDVLFAHLRPAELYAFSLGVCHPRTHAVADHTKLQLCEYARHLDECV